MRGRFVLGGWQSAIRMPYFACRVIPIGSSCSRYAHDLFQAFLILLRIGSLIIIAGFIAEPAIHNKDYPNEITGYFNISKKI
jgi:hypothetical protein